MNEHFDVSRGTGSLPTPRLEEELAIFMFCYFKTESITLSSESASQSQHTHVNKSIWQNLYGKH